MNSLARKAWRSGNPLAARFRVSRVATFIDEATGKEMKAIVEGEMFLSKIWDPAIDPPPIITATIVPGDSE